MQFGTCFKILLLQETLKTRTQHQEEHCAFLVATHLSPYGGCVRNRHQSHIVLQKLKLFLLMQVCEWMVLPLLIFGIWLLKCCILLPTNLRNPKRTCRETCCMAHHQENTPRTMLRLQYSTTILNYATSIMFPQTWSLLNLVRCCTSLRITKPWSKWLSTVEVQQWNRCPEPTELRLIGYLTESTWNQRSKSADTKNQQQRSSSCPRDLVSWALMEQWLNIVRFLHETSPDFTNLERKLHLEFSLGMR